MENQNNKTYISLAELPNNEEGLVSRINRGREVIARLISISIVPSQSIKKVCGRGPIMVKVNNEYSFALGKGIINKIVIEYNRDGHFGIKEEQNV